MVLSKGFSSGGGKRCTNELGEGQLVLFPPQCSGLIPKLRVLNIFMSIGSYSFQVVEVCISQVIKYVLELSSSAEHVMCNSLF